MSDPRHNIDAHTVSKRLVTMPFRTLFSRFAAPRNPSPMVFKTHEPFRFDRHQFADQWDRSIRVGAHAGGTPPRDRIGGSAFLAVNRDVIHLVPSVDVHQIERITQGFAGDDRFRLLVIGRKDRRGRTAVLGIGEPTAVEDTGELPFVRHRLPDRAGREGRRHIRPVPPRQFLPCVARYLSALSNSSGSLQPFLSARRSIPSAQLAVKEYFRGTGPRTKISDKDDTLPSLRDRPSKFGNSEVEHSELPKGNTLHRATRREFSFSRGKVFVLSILCASYNLSFLCYFLVFLHRKI